MSKTETAVAETPAEIKTTPPSDTKLVPNLEETAEAKCIATASVACVETTKTVPSISLDAWDGKKKCYRPELVTLVNEATEVWRQATEPTARIAELEAKLSSDIRPFREQQSRIAWQIARKVTEMRTRFAFRNVAKGMATPGSWPHFCRDILAQRGWLKDEKAASKQRRAIEYLEENFPEFEKKVLAGENLDAVPMPYEVAPLMGIADEQKRKELHVKVFSGQLSGRALIAALPKKSTTGNNGPKPYKLGDIADGAMQTLKRALDSVQAEGDAVWIANSNKGQDNAVEAVKAALAEIGVTTGTRVCWMIWVKK